MLINVNVIWGESYYVLDAYSTYRFSSIVDFATYSDMKQALEKLDGADLHGRRIRLVEDKSRRRIAGAELVPGRVLAREEAVNREAAANRGPALAQNRVRVQSLDRNRQNATTRIKASLAPEVAVNHQI
ncbi:Serine/arginine-rich splicing factor 4-like protein [Dinothrombium tinctorium]|uniref:Serine/arginine-rich splicing factor 4-like protein n=1 Tax=Dinothrombium tinctorium TaxID=1965070 RepID=A0A443RR96_9ACAR|nr:Serine/arginine-rich splicing factor 4-like protein [Dinothrombium tinctorium]